MWGDSLICSRKLEKISPAWILSKVLNSSSFGNPQLCMASCCYTYCNQFCDWRIHFNILSMIGWCNCLIKSVQSRPTVSMHWKIKEFLYQSHSRKLKWFQLTPKFVATINTHTPRNVQNGFILLPASLILLLSLLRIKKKTLS